MKDKQTQGQAKEQSKTDNRRKRGTSLATIYWRYGIQSTEPADKISTDSAGQPEQVTSQTGRTDKKISQSPLNYR
jgi:hypothetical protein